MQNKLIYAILALGSATALAQVPPGPPPGLPNAPPPVSSVRSQGSGPSDVPMASIQVPINPMTPTRIVTSAPALKAGLAGASVEDKAVVKRRILALDDLSIIQEEMALIKARAMVAEARADLYNKEAAERQAKRKEQEDIAEFDKKMSKSTKEKEPVFSATSSGKPLEEVASVYSIQGLGDDLTAQIYVEGMPSLATLKMGSYWRGRHVVSITQYAVILEDKSGDRLTIGTALGQSASDRLRGKSNGSMGSPMPPFSGSPMPPFSGSPMPPFMGSPMGSPTSLPGMAQPGYPRGADGKPGVVPPRLPPLPGN